MRRTFFEYLNEATATGATLRPQARSAANADLADFIRNQYFDSIPVNAIYEILEKHGIFGEDEGMKEKLIQQAKKLDVFDNLLFTGHVKDESLFLSAYAACDIFVLPSEYEAFGIVLLEAQACQKPVIVTRVGGVPEAIWATGIFRDGIQAAQ